MNYLTISPTPLTFECAPLIGEHLKIGDNKEISGSVTGLRGALLLTSTLKSKEFCK